VPSRLQHSERTYAFLKAAVTPALKGLAHVHTEGISHIPDDGPAILAANHLSFLDSLYVPMVLDRRVTYLAKAEYWDSWRTRWLLESAGHIPVHRGSAATARKTADDALNELKTGNLLGIYPEGTRSPDGRLHRGKSGVALLAARSGAPVIPIGIAGTAEIMPKGAKVPTHRGHVDIRFGSPMFIERDAPARGRRRFVHSLMSRIAALTGQEYVR
jgi:1-acyl-sn-glycerol-3-phosphate acyltransferase